MGRGGCNVHFLCSVSDTPVMLLPQSGVNKADQDAALQRHDRCHRFNQQRSQRLIAVFAAYFHCGLLLKEMIKLY